MYEIAMYRGDSYPLNFRLIDAETEAAIDLSDMSFVMTVDERAHPDDETTKMFSVDGVVGANPLLGEVSFTPLTTDTDLVPKKYYYDIQMTDLDLNVKTIVKSTLRIHQDISK